MLRCLCRRSWFSVYADMVIRECFVCGASVGPRRVTSASGIQDICNSTVPYQFISMLYQFSHFWSRRVMSQVNDKSFILATSKLVNSENFVKL